eukprot:8094437-Pyramimonas_sp.AAC.1
MGKRSELRDAPQTAESTGRVLKRGNGRGSAVVSYGRTTLSPFRHRGVPRRRGRRGAHDNPE